MSADRRGSDARDHGVGTAPSGTSPASTLDFRSDNVGGAAPKILAALASANVGAASAYGADQLSELLQQRYSQLFERSVEIFPVPTGTAANALALSACTPPWGAIFCHVTAHAHTSECGATEQFSQGAKFVLVEGEHGRVDPFALDRALSHAGRGDRHRSQPSTLTLTQATEWSTTYRLDEIDTLTELATKHGLVVHMDGARFANAVGHISCTPADSASTA